VSGEAAVEVVVVEEEGAGAAVEAGAVVVEGEGGAEIEVAVEADGVETVEVAEGEEEAVGDSVPALPTRLRRCGSRRRLRSTRT